MVSARSKPTASPHVATVPVSPADFRSVVLPWYSDRRTIIDTTTVQAQLDEKNQPRNIGRPGINIYCPQQNIEDYEQLICRESSLVQARVPDSEATHSLWLRGNPMRQFSPETLTELIFRLNHYFLLNDTGDTLRGIELTPAALTGERLALLSGLGFNRINLVIDASIASDNRSLSKLDAVFTHLADFDHISVESRILFGSESHPEFLSRLLRYLRESNCELIDFSLPTRLKPQTLDQRLAGARLLSTAITEMTEQQWAVTSNNQFTPKALQVTPDNLRLTPWGLQQQHKQQWLGLGIGAMGHYHQTYYRNDTDPEQYIAALNKHSLPSKTLFQKPPELASACLTMQDLICQHRVSSRKARELPGMDDLLKTGWLSRIEDDYCLTLKGIENLCGIHALLFTYSSQENYNGPVER